MPSSSSSRIPAPNPMGGVSDVWSGEWCLECRVYVLWLDCFQAVHCQGLAIRAYMLQSIHVARVPQQDTPYQVHSDSTMRDTPCQTDTHQCRQGTSQDNIQQSLKKSLYLRNINAPHLLSLLYLQSSEIRCEAGRFDELVTV